MEQNVYAGVVLLERNLKKHVFEAYNLSNGFWIVISSVFLKHISVVFLNCTI